MLQEAIAPGYSEESTIVVRKNENNHPLLTPQYVYSTYTARDIENKIGQLDTFRDAFRKRQDKIDKFEKYLQEHYESFDDDTLSDIANIFEFELTKEVDLVINVVFNVKATVPINEIDSLDVNVYDWDFEATNHDLQAETTSVNIMDWQMD